MQLSLCTFNKYQILFRYIDKMNIHSIHIMYTATIKKYLEDS